MQAVILAGGLGTRLKEVVKELPKPMAEINGRPFLEYLLDYLKNQGVNKVILSVGYKYELIQEYFKQNYRGIELEYSVESYPLGTGGALKLALSKASEENCFIINGDTLFEVDLKRLESFHLQKNSDITFSLKEMLDFERYGTVITNETGRITGFEEKKYKKYGLINGGVQIIRSNLFNSFDLEEKFSFEVDFIEKNYSGLNLYALAFDSYFIDIGIPEDYSRSQKEFKLLTF